MEPRGWWNVSRFGHEDAVEGKVATLFDEFVGATTAAVRDQEGGGITILEN